MLARTLIGIDLSPGIMRVARHAMANGVSSIVTDYLRLPADEAESSRMITGYFNAHGLAGLPVAVGIGGDDLFLNILSIAGSNRRARAEAVRQHLGELHSMSDSETQTGTAVLPAIAGRKRVLVGVARRDTLSRLITPLAETGCQIIAVTPFSLALFNLALSRTRSKKSNLVIVRPSRSAGDEVLIGSAADSLRGLWRIPSGLGDRPCSPASLKALAKCLEQDRLSRPAGDGQPPTLVWCGNRPLAADNANHIAAITGRQPQDICQWAPEACGKNPEFSAARSLIASRARTGPLRLNMLPVALRRRIAPGQRKPLVFALAALFLALAATITLRESLRLGHWRHRLEQETARQAQLSSLRQLKASLEENLEQLAAESRSLRQSALSAGVVKEMLAAVARARQSGDRILLVSDARSYLSDPQDRLPGIRGPAEASFSFSPSTFIVAGVSEDSGLDSIRRMITILRDHPLVADVDLMRDDLVSPEPDMAPSPRNNQSSHFVLEVVLHDT